MRTFFTFLFTLCTLFVMAQQQSLKDPGWTPILDSLGTEIVEGDYYLALITLEEGTLSDAMKIDIDKWLSSLNAVSKKDRGVIVSKAAFVNHEQVYDFSKAKEVARKNSLKGEWVLPK